MQHFSNATILNIHKITLAIISCFISGVCANEPISYNCKTFRYPYVNGNLHKLLDSSTLSRRKISFSEELRMNSEIKLYNCDSSSISNSDSSIILVNWKCEGDGVDNVNFSDFGATNSYILRYSKPNVVDTIFRLRNLSSIWRLDASHDTMRFESANFYGRKLCYILHEYVAGKSEKLCPTICEEECETVEFNKDEFAGILKRTKRYLNLSNKIDSMTNKEYNRRKNRFKHNYNQGE